MRKLVSLLVIVVMLSSAVYASGTLDVIEFSDDVAGNSYSFNLKYEILSGRMGDVHTIQLPFDVTIKGGEYLNVTDLGGSRYELELKDDFDRISGFIKGKRTVSSSNELKPIEVNGSVVKSDYPPISTGGQGGTGARDRFYKLGNIKDDIIYWEVAIGGDEKGVNGTSITDELGDGHILIQDSVRFQVLDNGQYNDDLIDMIVKNLDVSATEINFDIDTISPGEILYLTYQTKITDSDRVEFSNQLIIKGEQKIKQSVEIESDSGIDGEKPTKPTDPELPQVGESIFQPRFMLALALGVLSLVMRRKTK